jgi:transglutaminase-like putative cysteine protease
MSLPTEAADHPGMGSPLPTLLLLVPVVLAPALLLVERAGVAGIPWLAGLGMVMGCLLGRTRAPALALHLVALPVGAWLAVWAVGADPEALTRPGRHLYEPAVATLAWLVGYLGAFPLFRDDDPWWALIAGGAALLVDLAQASRAIGYVYLFLIAALLLVARATALGRARRWREAGAEPPGALPLAALPVGLAAAAALVGGAFLLPTEPVLERALDPLKERLESTSSPLGDARIELERLAARNRRLDAPYPLSGFGDAMTLQSQFRLGQQQIAHVSAPRGRYWRAITYQAYTGRGWRAGPTEPSRLAADESYLPAYERRGELRQSVRLLASRGDALLAAGQPVAFSAGATADLPSLVAPIPATGAVGPLPPGPRGGPAAALVAPAVGPAVGDPLSRDLAASVRAPSSSYRVLSAPSVATEAELRGAGGDYPAAVRVLYGSPPETTERVRRLAAALTSAYTNPYDRAQAVERHLRTLRYALEVVPPPADRDGADYFLFDSQTGYCDYFATAAVVLLRSAGIPARVASGYAVGEPDGQGGFVVRDLHAHSWVEAYFPRYGWIEFEPSPSRPLPERDRSDPPSDRGADGPVGPGAVSARPEGLDPLAATPTPASIPQSPAEPSAVAEARLAAFATPILAGMIALAGLAALLRLAWGWGIDDLPLAEAGYARMARLAGLLGRGPRAGQTPVEFALAAVAGRPRAAAAARLLADAYVESRWGARTPSIRADELAGAWRTVRGALLLRR